MKRVSQVGPSFPVRLLRWLLQPMATAWCAWHGLHRIDSHKGRHTVDTLASRLSQGETIRLAGLTAGSHNAGIAVVEVSAASGVRLVCSLEEERYSGRKHDHRFPQQCLDALHGVHVDAVVGSWDYPLYLTHALAELCAFLPWSLSALLPYNTRQYQLFNPREVLAVPERVRPLLNGATPFLGLRHHDNHAIFSHAVSPYASLTVPVLVLVLDGQGDDGNLTASVVENGQWRELWRNHDLFDSIAGMYAVLSSTQGGWTQLSSEGRFMGAAAWGCMDRLQNRYYRRLRQLLWFADNGQVRLNMAMANWPRDLSRPYTRLLEDILGPPVEWSRMWQPDSILNVDDIKHHPVTQDRVDKAAALQLLFEDAVVHIVEHMLRSTQGRASHLVWTGGAALNCVASMRLLDVFDEAWFTRTFNRTARLSVWVPPVPNDSGVAAGAAFNMAFRALRTSGHRCVAEPLHHAFYGGLHAPTEDEIQRDIEGYDCIDYIPVGPALEAAELLALMVSDGGVVGLFQGIAEIGPRALGHRSILANPTLATTRDILNARVKFRESVRPLAPMMTQAAAERFYYLGCGGYDFMVLTVRARPEARDIIPAVVHQDGTSRIQIVRQDIDPFCHAYLEALGRRTGAEVSVNTSLNIGAPIAHTPAQAIETMIMSRGMHAVFFIGSEGRAFLAWHRDKNVADINRAWLRAWRD